MTTEAEAAADLYGKLQPDAARAYRQHILSRTPYPLQDEMAPLLDDGSLTPTNWVDRFGAAVVAAGGTVSVARADQLKAMIGAMTGVGSWQKLDDMALLAAENQAQSLVLLKSGRLMTAVAAPTFTADRNWAFNGTTQYINSNWVPSTMAQRMTPENGRLACYERTDVGSAGTNIGATTGAAGTGPVLLRVRSATNTAAFQICTGAATWTISPITSIGLTSASRIAGSLTTKGWKRGVAQPDATATSPLLALTDRPLYLGARNSGAADQFRAASMAHAEWGAPFTDTAMELAHYNALQAHLTVIGANV